MKFLIGLLLFEGFLIGIMFFDDFRWTIGGIFLLITVTFSMALWALVRNKRFIVIVLVFAIATMPIRAEQKDNALLVGCCIVVVVALIGYTVYRICKKLPDLKKKIDAPMTNDTDEASSPVPTNALGVLTLPEWGLQMTTNWQTASIGFQSSTNGQAWDEEFSITNWFGEGLVVAVLYSNSVPLKTNCATVFWTNDPVQINFGNFIPPNHSDMLKLWRSQARD